MADPQLVPIIATVQVACQAANLNDAAVLFVSMEQSKNELRAKYLARHSKIQYRHLLRGHLRADDSINCEKLVEAFKDYALIARKFKIIEGDDCRMRWGCDEGRRRFHSWSPSRSRRER
ncbi:MAG: hypothetical protein AB7K24_18300 [Gemmataceae bacterium]